MPTATPHGVGVLHDHAGRVVESIDEAPCRLGVVQVEIAERFAAVLRHRVPPAGGTAEAIASALLVGVLAVPKDFGPFEGGVHRARQRLGLGFCGVEPCDDRSVVGGRVGERVTRQPAPRRQRDLAVFGHLDKHGRIVQPGRPGLPHGHGSWLRHAPSPGRRCRSTRSQADPRTGTDWRPPARSVRCRTRPCRPDARAWSDLPAGHRELGVQGDHAVIEDRRHAGQIGDVGDRHPDLGHGSGGTAARDDVPAEFVKRLGELGDSGLVVGRRAMR